MRRFLTVVATLALLASSPAWGRPPEVGRTFPNAERVGAAHYEVLSIRLFEAELWNESGDFSWENPFALSLTYQRAASAETLVNRSIREMSTRGAGDARELAPLRTQLERCMPSVNRGDRITGVSTGANTARFFFNGAYRCDVRWPGFRRSFFGIWLAGRDGAAARISAQLRGES